jgi:hypothetical protein
MSYSTRRSISMGPDELASTERSAGSKVGGQTVSYTVESPFEHRIGHRVTIDGLPAAFSDRPDHTVPVRLVDVSVTGAAMVVSKMAGIALGTRGRLVHQAVDTKVDVRRIEPGPDGSTVKVSVEFVELSGPLKEEIYDLVARHHSGAILDHPQV